MKRGLFYISLTKFRFQPQCIFFVRQIRFKILLDLSSENKTHLGVITKILDKQVVELKIIKNGKSCLTNMHCSLIRLIYRADDPESYLNLCVTALKA